METQICVGGKQREVISQIVGYEQTDIELMLAISALTIARIV